MKKIKIGKIIGIIFFMIIVLGLSYVITYYVDEYYEGDETPVINVIFDDTKTYVIPNTKLSTKEESLETWPYMFTVQNKGGKKGLYQIVLTKEEASDIEEENLSYLLVLDDEEIKEGSLNDLKDRVLYEGEIAPDINQRYKLYIWVDSEQMGSIYEYSLSLIAIKAGGPGF